MAVIETLFGDEAGILRERQFRLLLLANINAALGTVLVSPLLESLTGPFAVSDVRIGLLMTAFTAPPVLGIPLVGMLSDRYGRKPVLVVALLLFGLSGAGVALTTDFRVALAMRVLQGIGYAGVTPVVITSIGDLYTGSGEATAQGLRFTSSGAAQAVFPLVAGVLVGVAWQYPFFIYLIAIPIAVLVAVFFEETGTTDTDDRAGAKTGAEADGGRERSRWRYVRGLATLSAQPKIAAVLFAFAMPGFLYIGFVTYNSFLVVRVLDSTPGVAGAVITIVSVVYATAASQAGRITDYFGSRVIPLVVAHLVMGLGLTLFALAPGLPVALGGAAIMGLGVGLCFSLLRSVLTSLAPEAFRGGLVGVGESVIRLSNSLVPLVLGWVIAALTPAMGADGGIRYALVGVGVAAGVLGAITMVVARAAPAVPDQWDVEGYSNN